MVITLGWPQASAVGQGSPPSTYLLGEVVLLVQKVAQATSHAGANIAPSGANAHHGSAGHVLTTVVTCALHDGHGHGVAHGKALAYSTLGGGMGC